MPSSTPQQIPNTRLTGPQTFTFLNTDQLWSTAEVTIDRTVSGGLNSLTVNDTLSISIDYSRDGGTTWHNAASGITIPGGVLITKGVTQASASFTIGAPPDNPFPVGTAFRIETVASTPVRIAGSYVYSI